MNDYHYCLGQRFGRVAARQPVNIALRFVDGQEVRFGELDALSNRLAHYLEYLGIEKGEVVGLFHDKSLLGYAFMLACLKIGAVYVNFDPDSPPSRLTKIVSACRPKVILAGEGWSMDQPELAGCPVRSYTGSSLWAALMAYSDKPPQLMEAVDGSTPAYLMYTSGSTGFPKGVIIPHSAVLNFIDWSRTTFRITSDDVLTGINPPFFDNSVFDFFASLFNGATLAPIPQGLARIPKRMVEEVDRQGCTIWFSVPSMLVYILTMRALSAKDCTLLRSIIFGGEGFPKTALGELHGLVGKRVELINVYGPTEGTCICSAYRVGEADIAARELLPLGEIAPNFSYRILNACNQPVAPGEVGELCLLGPQLALGYYNNAEQTKKSFIPDPLQPNYRVSMYRTGDLVRYDETNGVLHFAGRKDNQIKRMGYRIELEEIDIALGALPDVSEAVSVFVKAGDNDRGTIVSWIAGRLEDRDETAKVIETGLRELLPSYMIPDQLKFFSVLPKNQNGKVDRKAVLAAEMEGAGA